MSKFVSDRVLKNIINITFLALSSFLIVYFLVNLTPNPVIRVGVGIFAIILEVFMQYLLGTGRAKWKGGLCVQAILLFLCYGVYVLVYAVPSATGFFMAEISAQEEQSTRAVVVDQTSRDRLTQINSTITNLNAQLQTESKSGYGQRSQVIMDRIDNLTKEQTAIQNHFRNTPPAVVAGAKDLFKVLGDVFGIPGNVFKILIFGISVLMVYVGLIMTSWDLSDRRPIVETPRKPEVFEFETHSETDFETKNKADTDFETPKSLVKRQLGICPTCGGSFRPRSGRVFCSSKCRLKAYRQKEAS